MTDHIKVIEEQIKAIKQNTELMMTGCTSRHNSTLYRVEQIEKALAELRDNDEYVVIYEDAYMKPEHIQGHNEAQKLFEIRSESWNCHLFKKLKQSYPKEQTNER